MLGHITLKDHAIIQELFKRSPVGLLLKSTGNWSRSGLQEYLLALTSSPLD